MVFVGAVQWLVHGLSQSEAAHNYLLPAVVFAAVLLLARSLASSFWRSALGLPPGPLGLPVFGYLPFLKGHVHLLLSGLARVYGPVYRLYLGNQLVVVVTDPKVIRDAFRLDVFTGRPSTVLTKILGGYGVINTEGELWKEQRRFIHDRLRNFGARGSQNRDDLEKRITGEVRTFLRVMAEVEGSAYDMHHLLACSFGNVICSMLMSVRFCHKDPRFLRFLHLMDEGLRLFALTLPINFIPALRYVPGINRAYHKITQNRQEMFAFFADMVEQHRATMQPGNPRDFLDAYLDEIDAKRRSGVTSYFSENQLNQVIGDLFSAGMEPVKDTLQWAVLYMITYPDVQSKVQEELDGVVGSDRLPSYNDQPYLPYTEATLLEVQRMANVLAIGTSRSTLQSTTLGGYRIPKDAHVLPLLWAVHMDPARWDRPDVFDPSRFLDKSGRVHKPDYFMPFSTGRRMCLGDVLAKMEIFLFFSSLLHEFTVTVPEGEPTPSLEGVTAVTRSPSQFKVVAARRRDTLCTLDIFGES